MNEPGPECSPLTQLQRNMYICGKLPLYRLPLLYPLRENESYEDVRQAVTDTLLHYPALQVRYSYLPESRSFIQRHVPLEADTLEISVVKECGDAVSYIRSSTASVDPADGYPWRLQFLEDGNRRYLYLEFHHICIDGLGIRNLEETLEARLAGRPPGPRGRDFESYLRVSDLEASCGTSSGSFGGFSGGSGGDSGGGSGREEPAAARIPPAGKGGSPAADRVCLPLTGSRWERVERIARRLGVSRNAVCQAAVEEAVRRCGEGAVYGVIGNWRMAFGSFRDVGCHVRIIPGVIGEAESPGERMKRIFAGQLPGLRREPEAEEGAGSRMEYAIVYSYEENLFRRMRFIPADRLSKFDIYIRVCREGEEAKAEIEYNRSKYEPSQMMQLLGILDEVLENCAQEEEESGELAREIR
ncbi:hypothetical protein F4V43_16455 [Paenibacillus spiritus]|uniref:Condensation domain-containing protein n=1 Tax=Paenibacillus spiritus TaxID=2496557 RepID=A0A5J5FYI9_9BACL|nr:condensation domain-containing protein [Paenibacillus spiritus]KAA8998818.1 hypothetical protein F4V43_16455 [Paenibacillus spiritus]